MLLINGNIREEIFGRYIIYLLKRERYVLRENIVSVIYYYIIFLMNNYNF